MTIQITKPEVEALINQRLKRGGLLKTPKMSSCRRSSLLRRNRQRSLNLRLAIPTRVCRKSSRP